MRSSSSCFFFASSACRSASSRSFLASSSFKASSSSFLFWASLALWASRTGWNFNLSLLPRKAAWIFVVALISNLISRSEHDFSQVKDSSSYWKKASVDGSSNTYTTFIRWVSISISSTCASRSFSALDSPSGRGWSASRGWLTHRPTTCSIAGWGIERRIITSSGSSSFFVSISAISNNSSLERESSSKGSSSPPSFSSSISIGSSTTFLANKNFRQEFPRWSAWMLAAAAFSFSRSNRKRSASSSSKRFFSRAAASILLT